MLRDLRWVTLSEFVSFGSSLLVVPILTRGLIPAQYGLYRSMFVLFSLTLLLKQTAGVQTLIKKVTPELDGHRREGFVSATVVFHGVLLGLSVVGLFVAVTLGSVSYISPKLQSFVSAHLVLVMAFLLTKSVYSLSLSLYQGTNSFKRFSIVRTFREAGVFLTVASLYVLDFVSLVNVILLYVVTDGLVAFWSMIRLRDIVVSPPNWGRLRTGLGDVSLPLAPRSFIKKAGTAVPKSLIVTTFGPALFASWTVTFTFMQVFNLIGRPFSQILLPKISKQNAEARSFQPLISKYYRFMCVVTIPTVVGGWLVGPQIVRFAFGPAYLLEPMVLGILVTGFGLRTINVLSGNFIIGTGSTAFETMKLGVLNGVLIGGVYLGTMVYESLVVVALGYLGKHVVNSFISLYYQRQYVEFPIPDVLTLVQFVGSITAMSGVVLTLESRISGLPSLLLVVAVGGVAYVLSLLLSGFVTEDDIETVSEFSNLGQ